MDLADDILSGDVRAAARLMRRLDDGDPAAAPVMARLYPRTGRGRLVGVTGSPGTGKSTLIDALIERMRSAGRRVGVVAVDPTSPFSGGAILGDRVRMQRHATDPGVFIRSLATRGRLGGLSASTAGVAQVLDAMGFERVVIETVGVGQDEVEVVSLADVVVVVVSPGQGDDVQAQKAGVLEIADILAVTKADLPGADRAVRELRAAASLAPAGARHPPVLAVSATTGTGIDDLVAEIERRLSALDAEGRHEGVVRGRTEAIVADLAVQTLAARVRGVMASDPAVRDALDAVARRETDPGAVAGLVLERVAGTGER
jgi:LAO/AO transport system kinase